MTAALKRNISSKVVGTFNWGFFPEMRQMLEVYCILHTHAHTWPGKSSLKNHKAALRRNTSRRHLELETWLTFSTMNTMTKHLKLCNGLSSKSFHLGGVCCFVCVYHWSVAWSYLLQVNSPYTQQTWAWERERENKTCMDLYTYQLHSSHQDSQRLVYQG